MWLRVLCSCFVSICWVGGVALMFYFIWVVMRWWFHVVSYLFNSLSIDDGYHVSFGCAVDPFSFFVFDPPSFESPPHI